MKQEDDFFETYDPNEEESFKTERTSEQEDYEIADDELFDAFPFRRTSDSSAAGAGTGQSERKRSSRQRHAGAKRSSDSGEQMVPRSLHTNGATEDEKNRASGGEDGSDEAAPPSDKRTHKKIVLVAGDRPLMVVIAALLIISVFVMMSSTLYKAGGTPGDKLSTHMTYMGIGLSVLLVIHAIRYQAYRQYSKYIFLFGFALTVLSIIFGLTEAEARRDLRIPYVGISFQPFELLKIGLIMLLANQLAARQQIIDRIRILPSFRPSRWGRYPEKNKKILYEHTIPIFAPIVLTCIITYFSVGNSTTLIIIGTCVLMFFIGRVNIRDIAKLTALGAAAALVLFAAGAGRADTGKSRLSKFSPDIFTEHVAETAAGIVVYDNPDEADQSINAKMSIASGRIFGKGPGMSTHRSNLQEVERDFVYAFIIEEYGLLGGVIVLALYLWLFSRGIVIFKRCGTAFPSLLVLGLSMMILFQALFHMGVSVSLLPVTGQQLPLISKGGTSMVFTLLALGMILGISRQTMQKTLDTAKGESLFEQSKNR